MSLTLAAEIARVSGRPWLSHSRWSLEPGLPRSVGFGLVFSPWLGADRRGVDGGASPAGCVCSARPGGPGGYEAIDPSGSRSFNQRWAVARVTPNKPSAFSQEHLEAWTNSTVVSTALWSARDWPVLGAGGSSGWTISQSPSGNTSLTGCGHARHGATSQRF